VKLGRVPHRVGDRRWTPIDKIPFKKGRKEKKVEPHSSTQQTGMTFQWHRTLLAAAIHNSVSLLQLS